MFSLSRKKGVVEVSTVLKNYSKYTSVQGQGLGQGPGQVPGNSNSKLQIETRNGKSGQFCPDVLPFGPVWFC